MRLNKAIALSSGLSRRAADTAIQNHQVTVNGEPAVLGQEVSATDVVALEGKQLNLAGSMDKPRITIMLHKPIGYVVSRNGQGSPTVYELLPESLRSLRPIGRLDKNSSGLLLLTDDGQFAHIMTHPGFRKRKVYEVLLDAPMNLEAEQQARRGVGLEDGVSQLELKPLNSDRTKWQVELYEGRNRQIRRTFAALGYTVRALYRHTFGQYQLGNLPPGKHRVVATQT